jgi:Family of unknown function (DUF6114)
VSSSGGGGDSGWVNPDEPPPHRNTEPQGSPPWQIGQQPAGVPAHPPADADTAVAPQASGPVLEEPVPAGAGMAGAWRSFRAWRRTRPFWGGLLLLLAGLELLGIPLLSELAHGSVKVVIYIGIGGVFGVLIGGLLVACGLLTWFHPVQRVFYAIAGVLLAVLSFVATNLGGFFLGMLLGVTGASLSFGWTPGPGWDGGGHHRPRPRHRDTPGAGLGLLLGRGTSPGDTTDGSGQEASGAAAGTPDAGVRQEDAGMRQEKDRDAAGWLASGAAGAAMDRGHWPEGPG